jgi:hypothetical protein
VLGHGRVKEHGEAVGGGVPAGEELLGGVRSHEVEERLPAQAGPAQTNCQPVLLHARGHGAIVKRELLAKRTRPQRDENDAQAAVANGHSRLAVWGARVGQGRGEVGALGRIHVTEGS